MGGVASKRKAKRADLTKAAPPQYNALDMTLSPQARVALIVQTLTQCTNNAAARNHIGVVRALRNPTIWTMNAGDPRCAAKFAQPRSYPPVTYSDDACRAIEVGARTALQLAQGMADVAAKNFAETVDAMTPSLRDAITKATVSGDAAFIEAHVHNTIMVLANAMVDAGAKNHPEIIMKLHTPFGMAMSWGFPHVAKMENTYLE